MSDTADLAAVLGRIPSGLFVVTARDGSGQTTAMLASWVQQSGFDPPAISIAVNKERYLNDWLQQTSRLGVCIIAESQKALLAHFGKGFEPGADAFGGLVTTDTADGIRLLSDCIGWLAGDVVGSVDSGDHVVYIVRPTEVGRGSRIDGELPWVHLRKSGLGY
jgi:flavin reductase (DIM6/NTAB) family NADH-FMN oxidoreductase RutF